MDDPGKISWNWYKRTSFQTFSISSWGYSPFPKTLACIAANSKFLRAISIFLLYFLFLPCVVYVPWCFSKYNSPLHTLYLSISFSILLKKLLEGSCLTGAIPFIFLSLLNLSKCSSPGPSPPSPIPNSIKHSSDKPLSKKAFSDLATALGAAELL